MVEGYVKAKKITGRIQKVNVIHKDTYQLAVQQGYKGTIEEWLASLKGDPGVGYLTDRTTGTKYNLYVNNGKLCMEVAE